jgi:transcriptional regulator with XRE-family HTH domain|tara:strand:+ start:302 stop:532 length:231 start_codon:yes stop_codon:yes gene_type:complete
VRNTVKYQHKALIDKLTNLRQERKLSQEKLALTIGVDTKLFGQWERKLVEPKLFNLLCWCEALQVYLTISNDDGEF